LRVGWFPTKIALQGDINIRLFENRFGWARSTTKGTSVILMGFDDNNGF
jgi:hypothetical protein